MTDVAHLALGDEVVEGAQRLVDGCDRVRRVQLIEVDPLRAEPAQRCLHRAPHVTPRPAGRGLVDAAVECGMSELGRDYDVVAAPPESTTEQLLAEPRSFAIDIRR